MQATADQIQALTVVTNHFLWCANVFLWVCLFLAAVVAVMEIINFVWDRKYLNK